jgi:hypothetical protein
MTPFSSGISLPWREGHQPFLEKLKKKANHRQEKRKKTVHQSSVFEEKAIPLFFLDITHKS